VTVRFSFFHFRRTSSLSAAVFCRRRLSPFLAVLFAMSHRERGSTVDFVDETSSRSRAGRRPSSPGDSARSLWPRTPLMSTSSRSDDARSVLADRSRERDQPQVSSRPSRVARSPSFVSPARSELPSSIRLPFVMPPDDNWTPGSRLPSSFDRDRWPDPPLEAWRRPREHASQSHRDIEPNAMDRHSSSAAKNADANRLSRRRDMSPMDSKSPVRLVASVERRSATIKLGVFTGTNIPLETHLAKLRNCADYYGWTEADRVCHLKASLEGNAAAILWELSSDCIEKDLIQLLRSRFGDKEQIERFRFELKTRRRKKGETIQALHQDICRLLALSYPGETGLLSQIVARDAFLDSLNDPEMRIRILEKDAKSIEEAYSIAARFEAFTVGAIDVSSFDDGGRRRARAVNLHQETPSADRELQRRVDSVESSLAELRIGIQQLLQRQSVTSPAVSHTAGAPYPSIAAPMPSSFAPVGQLVYASPSAPVVGNAMPPTVTALSPSAAAMPTATARRQKRAVGNCFNCSQPGHIARNCPLKTEAPPPTDSSAKSYQVSSADCNSETYMDVRIRQKGGNVITVHSVLDSGCSHSVIPSKYCSVAVQPTPLKLFAANNTEIPVLGKAHVKFSVNGLQLSADVLVSEFVDEFLLSYSWLRDNGCVWDFASSTVTIQGRAINLQTRRSCANVRRVYVADNILVEKRSIANIPVRLAYASLRPHKILILFRKSTSLEPGSL
jgi:hypothetical protein